MNKRKYFVTFRSGTKFENKFVHILADNKDMAYSQACAVYGFLNVGGVYVDNDYNYKALAVRGLKELK